MPRPGEEFRSHKVKKFSIKIPIVVLLGNILFLRMKPIFHIVELQRRVHSPRRFRRIPSRTYQFLQFFLLQRFQVFFSTTRI